MLKIFDFKLAFLNHFVTCKRAKILGLHIENLGFLILTSHNGCEEQLQIHLKLLYIQLFLTIRTYFFYLSHFGFQRVL